MTDTLALCRPLPHVRSGQATAPGGGEGQRHARAQHAPEPAGRRLNSPIPLHLTREAADSIISALA